MIQAGPSSENVGVKELCASTVRFVDADVEVACDDEVVRSGCSDGQERLKLIEESCEWFSVAVVRVRLVDIEDG